MVCRQISLSIFHWQLSCLLAAVPGTSYTDSLGTSCPHAVWPGGAGQLLSPRYQATELNHQQLTADPRKPKDLRSRWSSFSTLHTAIPAVKVKVKSMPTGKKAQAHVSISRVYKCIITCLWSLWNIVTVDVWSLLIAAYSAVRTSVVTHLSSKAVLGTCSVPARCWSKSSKTAPGTESLGSGTPKGECGIWVSCCPLQQGACCGAGRARGPGDMFKTWMGQWAELVATC